MRVEIRKATGGAHIDPDRDRVEVIISANDFVAGVLRFAKTAYLVREGGYCYYFTARNLYLIMIIV